VAAQNWSYLSSALLLFWREKSQPLQIQTTDTGHSLTSSSLGNIQASQLSDRHFEVGNTSSYIFQLSIIM